MRIMWIPETNQWCMHGELLEDLGHALARWITALPSAPPRWVDINPTENLHFSSTKQVSIHASRRGNSRHVWLTAADNATRNNTLIIIIKSYMHYCAPHLYIGKSPNCLYQCAWSMSFWIDTEMKDIIIYHKVGNKTLQHKLFRKWTNLIIKILLFL